MLTLKNQHSHFLFLIFMDSNLLNCFSDHVRFFQQIYNPAENYK